MNQPVQPPASAYFITPEKEANETRTLAVLVDNEPGVLARVIGLFSGRGYNIESLTVSETEHEKHLSRITVVTRGAPHVIEQLKSQLDRIVPVHRVVDLTRIGGANGDNDPIERELAILKVAGQGQVRGHHAAAGPRRGLPHGRRRPVARQGRQVASSRRFRGRPAPSWRGAFRCYVCDGQMREGYGDGANGAGDRVGQ